MFVAALRCKKCFRLIVLPQVEPTDRLPWPEDGRARNLMCLGCLQAFEYTAKDVRRERVWSGKSSCASLHTCVYYVQAKCLARNCEALVRFNVIADKSRDNRQLSQIARGKALYGKAYCEARHQLTGPAVSIVAIGVDADWPNILYIDVQCES